MVNKDNILEVRNLYFSYERGKKTVLFDVNLEFERSKVYGIIGANGSGKTTLLKILASILKPNSGNVLLEGKDIKNIPQKEFASKVSFLPQENSFGFDVSVFYFLLLSRYPFIKIYKSFSREDYKIVYELLKKFNIENLSDRYLNELSGGEKRKVLLASLFVASPEVFILDEPDSFLDPSNKIEVDAVLRKLKKEGKATIFTSHSLELITDVADKIVGIEEGKIVYFGENLYERNKDIFSKIFKVKYNFLKSKDRIFFVYE